MKLSNFKKANFNSETTLSSLHEQSTLTLQSVQYSSAFTISDVNKSIVDILNTNTAKINFQNVTWRKTPDGSRYQILAEDCLEESGMQKRDHLLDDYARYLAVTEFYRQMKKRNRDEQNDAEASLWHYAEKEVQLKLHRLEKRYSFQHIMLEFYRIISRYGEDPLQALTFAGYLLVGLFFALSLGAIPYLGKLPADITWVKVDKFFHCYFQYLLFIKPDWSPPIGIFDNIALLLSRLLIPIQAAIFAFALRNKLHR